MSKKTYLFTSESVSAGHPDKVSDQISDAILDEFLRQDPNSKVACEVFCTTGLVVVGGEVNTQGYVDVQKTAREVVNYIGYNKAEYMFDGNSCGVLSAIHGQSGDINRGVERINEDQGAGDQGIMFGYATDESDNYMPLPLDLSHRVLIELDHIRKNSPELMPYLRPDAKSQFTLEYDLATSKPVKVHTILVSTQHDEFVAPSLYASCIGGEYDYSKAKKSYSAVETKVGTEKIEAEMQSKIREDIYNIVLPRVIAQLSEDNRKLFTDYKLLVNPTGKFTIGGPHGDTGLTGRKIIVDSYGGFAQHGGGAFSGKDASKVDRSATYAARYIAKNLVAAGVASRVTVQLAYAIGVARPLSIFVDTYGTCKCGVSDAEIAARIEDIFDLRPAKIIEKFDLTKPIFSPTASYGHFGKAPYEALVDVCYDGKPQQVKAQFFGWEKLDSVDLVRKAFGL
ncbi:MAG: methionine adenosyltransferase [Bacteroidales bacterium]|nr:methionine adenosyltransferase [Bacteroidales bacterium]